MLFRGSYLVISTSGEIWLIRGGPVLIEPYLRASCSILSEKPGGLYFLQIRLRNKPDPVWGS